MLYSSFPTWEKCSVMTIKGKVSGDDFFPENHVFCCHRMTPHLLLNIGQASTSHTEKRSSELEKGGHYSCNTRRRGGEGKWWGWSQFRQYQKHMVFFPYSFPVGTLSKRVTIFPSPAGMSLNKLPRAGNNYDYIIPGQGEFG